MAADRGSGKLSEAQKAALNPFAEMFGEMSGRLYDMSDEQQDALSDAVDHVSETNCWCMMFDAAKWLRIQINREKLGRSAAGRAALASHTKGE